jgi:DNA-directed RNA polymerase sigma subunit (sigma70/sigma32)
LANWSDLENLSADLKPNQRPSLNVTVWTGGTGQANVKQIAQKFNFSHSKVRSAHGQGMKALRREQDQIKNYLVY